MDLEQKETFPKLWKRCIFLGLEIRVLGLIKQLYKLHP